MNAGDSKSKIPKVFISYSWDSSEHKSWVKDLAADLENEGVSVTLDQWDVSAGDFIDVFMERSITETDFVLIICTPGYKKKFDNRNGGVGYEANLITAEVRATKNRRKLIPILRSGEWGNSAPLSLQNAYYIDLSGNEYSRENYQELLDTIFNRKGRKRKTHFKIKGGYSMKYSPPAPLINLDVSSSVSKILGIKDASVKVPMVLDSGADISCIPKVAINELEMVLENKLPYGLVMVEDFNGEKLTHKSYVLNIKTEDNTIIIEELEFLEVSGEEGVLGRDFLNNFKITLDGPLSTFEIVAR